MQEVQLDERPPELTKVLKVDITLCDLSEEASTYDSVKHVGIQTTQYIQQGLSE